MFSDLSSYMYKYVAGISPDEEEPGFKHVIFKPAIDSSLEYASASHESMHGKVLCDWKKEDGKVTVKVVIPFGTHGTLYVPERFAGAITANGEAVQATVENGKAVMEFVSGEYVVEM
jgi:alpha-L-rhamnosidase